MRHAYSFFGRKSLRTIAIVAGSMAIAFIVGIETASDIQPVVRSTNAGGSVLRGDLNGNGALDLSDLRIALELARGDRTPSPKELSADPDQNFQFTIADAISIVSDMENMR